MERIIPIGTMSGAPTTVSVCMITYNQALYIRQAIDGVLMQKTNFPFELIISDDCSADETRDICRHYQLLYPEKIKLLFPEKNLGISANFYTTLFSARAKYIAFCEGDDYWIDPDKLQKQVDYLDAHPHTGCVYTDFNLFLQKSGQMKESLFHTCPEYFPKHKDLVSFVCTPLYLAPCTWMLRRELLVKPSFDSVDATFVLFAHFLSSTEIDFMPDTTAVYRELPESASHSASLKKTYIRVAGLYAAQMELFNLYGLPEDMKAEVTEKYYLSHLKLLTAFGDKKRLTHMRHVLQGKRLRTRRRLCLQVLSRVWIGRWIMRWLYERSYRKHKCLK